MLLIVTVTMTEMAEAGDDNNSKVIMIVAVVVVVVVVILAVVIVIVVCYNRRQYHARCRTIYWVQHKRNFNVGSLSHTLECGYFFPLSPLFQSNINNNYIAKSLQLVIQFAIFMLYCIFTFHCYVSRSSSITFYLGYFVSEEKTKQPPIIFIFNEFWICWYPTIFAPKY